MIKSVRFATGLICVGLVLLAGSFVWPHILPQEVIWNEQQAREKANAAADLHRMTHVAAHAEIDNIKDEQKQAVRDQLEDAQTRFDDSKSAMERGLSIRDTTALVLFWCGIVLTTVGVVRYKVIQSDDRHQRPQRR